MLFFKRLFTFAGIIFVILLGIIGCGGGNGVSRNLYASNPDGTCANCTANQAELSTASVTGATTTRIASFSMYTPGNGAIPSYYDSAGKLITHDEFIVALKALPRDPTKSIGLNLLQSQPTIDQATGRFVKIPFTCLGFDIRWEYGSVSTCFKLAGQQWHLNIQFRNTCRNIEYFNVHAMAWWDNGPQFGLYESVHNWCFRSVGKWTAIRDKFLLLEGDVGVTGWGADVAADVEADVVVGAFAL